MRFLCLHGRGTNSDIFESQLAALFSRISPQHSFDFIDAPFECPAAPGISRLYHPPYLAWHSQYEPQHVQPVHDFLSSVIEEDGPYDGLIGFSQGAALAASFLLCHEYFKEIRCQARDGHTPFKVAIFFNSVMLFSPSENIGSNISAEIRRQEEKHTAFLQGLAPSPLENGDGEIEIVSSQKDSSGVFSSRSYHPKVFGFPPETFPTRISIPTLHVLGANDQFAEHSRALIKLCRSDNAEVLVIKGGHEMPRTEKALDACAELFELVTMTASLGALGQNGPQHFQRYPATTGNHRAII